MAKGKKKAEKKVERQLVNILIFFGFLILIFIIASAVFKSLNKVEYEGLTFTKEKYGQIPVYHYYYSFKSPSGKILQYHMYLRHDPSLNNVPIQGDKIKIDGKTVYITLDTSYLNQCSDTSIAIPSLTRFFADNQINVKSGNMDFTEAAIYGQEVVTCENRPESDVVQLRRGNETGITVNGDCIDVTIGPDCRIMEAVEKLEVHTYLDAQER